LVVDPTRREQTQQQDMASSDALLLQSHGASINTTPHHGAIEVDSDDEAFEMYGVSVFFSLFHSNE